MDTITGWAQQRLQAWMDKITGWDITTFLAAWITTFSEHRKGAFTWGVRSALDALLLAHRASRLCWDEYNGGRI